MTNQQQFIQYATEGAKIDAIVALRLLIEAYISECGFSIGMRTLIYTASEVWCYWRLPLNPNNPLSQEQIEEEPFVRNMPILYDGYKAELYDKYDIAPGYSEADFERMCIQEIDRYDEDTMRVLCWGIYFLPKANRHFYKIEFADEEEAAAYIKKQREKLQKDIESSSTGGYDE